MATSTRAHDKQYITRIFAANSEVIIYNSSRVAQRWQQISRTVREHDYYSQISTDVFKILINFELVSLPFQIQLGPYYCVRLL